MTTCFKKTDGLPVDIIFESVSIRGNIFIPKSKLNALRREFYDLLMEKLTQRHREEYVYQPFETMIAKGALNKIAVIGTAFDDVQADIIIYKPDHFLEDIPDSVKKGLFEKYLYYPAFCTSKDEEALDKLLENGVFDGIYTESYAGI